MSLIKPGTGYWDSKYSELVIPTLPFWYDYGFTPNDLTTFGFLATGGMLYNYWFNNPKVAIALLLIRMYFDSADGLLARKYKLSSEFGDVYDHFVDAVFGIGMLIITYKAFPKTYRTKAIAALLISYLLMSTQMSCMDIECGEKCTHNTTLKVLSPLGFMCGGGMSTIFSFLDVVVLYGVCIGVILARDNVTVTKT